MEELKQQIETLREIYHDIADPSQYNLDPKYVMGIQKSIHHAIEQVKFEIELKYPNSSHETHFL